MFGFSYETRRLFLGEDQRRLRKAGASCEWPREWLDWKDARTGHGLNVLDDVLDAEYLYACTRRRVDVHSVLILDKGQVSTYKQKPVYLNLGESRQGNIRSSGCDGGGKTTMESTTSACTSP